MKNLKVGVNFKNSIAKDILKFINQIDIIEVYTERFFQELDLTLTQILDKVPLSLHGLDLSLGSENELNQNYKKNLKNVLNQNDHFLFSDHLSMTKINQVEVGHLMPVAFTEERLQHIILKIKEIKRYTHKTFLLENISYYYQIPGSEMSEAVFFDRIVKESDCGILLDINNLVINSINHNYHVDSFLKNLDMSRVKEIHLAGGSTKFGMQIDTHANDISNEVWRLYERILKISSPEVVIIERDDNIQSYNQILEEVNMAKRLAKCLTR